VLVSDSSIGDRAWPEIAGAPDGGVHIVWVDFRHGDEVVSLYTSYSEDGTSFRANVKANLEYVGPNCTPPMPDIGISAATGRIHLVWRQSISYSLRHVYSCYSNDGGLTFSPPVAVTEDVWIFDG